MIFRWATIDDLPDVLALVNGSGGYEEIDEAIAISGGDWYLAVDNNAGDIVAGCVWGAKDRQHAYIDYLALLPAYDTDDNWRLLLDMLITWLHNQYGINFIHGLLWRNDMWKKVTENALAPLPDSAGIFYKHTAAD